MKKLFPIIMSVVLIFLTEGAWAVEDANEILKIIDKNLMPDSYETYRQLINEEPDGKKKEFTFFTLKKGKDKIAMLYLSPASEKGRSTLRLGDNMWLFIPNVNKPVRITSLQSVVGGVFNNADIMTLDYSEEYDATIESKTGAEYILTLKAKTKTVAYDKLRMWATKDKKILKKVECYGASGMLIKTLEFKNDKDFGNGLVRPSVVETYSPLYKGYKSFMIYQKVKARQVPDEAFTQQFMNRLGQLR
ncbi:MAG: outer membrane lipoprotein-sorting protein [Bdellovibrionales bacterium RIFOXYB1_FULL_37_110]|nr:MAG: outer membrane lipoprotein-sorting protein [Bdellovibrionales bacterium RIFOXYC1_FULL_37_79]OFZ57325.1 MAG: outer membrane lipoprotein-sorting protein [Bdellovibrionales bacterium RIFOXYB1_FULL_37_110]OFZ62221.1 MAG: outer membrane lipoprotein-sorting protein [Bdellovibrionales bacterium RIFOXYD1_FULL_36_51]